MSKTLNDFYKKKTFEIAEKNKWIHREEEGLKCEGCLTFTFVKHSAEHGEMKIVVYVNTKKVVTYLTHPKKTKPSRLFRQNVGLGELEKIFKNPRVHTGKGKYRIKNVR